jgi:thiol-disulfide isomerase/thioredoxin
MNGTKAPRFLFLLLLASCMSPSEEGLDAAAKGKAGSPAPGFTLRGTAGARVSLSDFKGKVVFLDFWATWCPPCRMSTPAVIALSKKLSGEKAEVIGVNLDEDTDVVVPHIKKEGVPYLTLYGSEGSVAQDYGVHAIPSFFVIDPKGGLVKKYSGFYPGMEREWEKEIRALLKR